MTRQKSTVETIRNNRRMMASHNAIVIMHSHKQRQRDNANNASVIWATTPSRHNAIVISRFCGQAFVTKQNISSAYLSYKPGLSITSWELATDTHRERVPIRIHIMIRKPLGAGLIENDSHYQENPWGWPLLRMILIIRGSRGKSRRGQDTHLAGP